MASFVILITTPPSNHQSSLSALKFAEAVIKQGHSITTLFFHQDGAHHANPLLNIAPNELDSQALFRTFATEHAIPLKTCISASVKRGVFDEQSKEDMPDTTLEANVAAPWQIVGLFEFVQAASEADKVIHFK